MAKGVAPALAAAMSVAMEGTLEPAATGWLTGQLPAKVKALEFTATSARATVYAAKLAANTSDIQRVRVRMIHSLIN